MKKYLLSIDDGGTYIKAAIHNFQGEQIALTREYNEVLVPKADWTEYDQEKLWKTNCDCIRRLFEESGISPDEISCVGLSAQGSGYYAVDEHGNSIRNAISSSDGRGKAIVEGWSRSGLLDETYDSVFHYAWSGHLNTILAWLKQNEPDSYAKSRYLFAMKDYLIYRLTGNVISSFGCQSESGLLDMNSLSYSSILAEKFGIEGVTKRFGPLLWDVEICGTVSEEASLACGLSVGTPVCAGCHDVVATAIAMGITESEYCFIITGTHGINGYISDHPVLNKTIGNNEVFAIPGKYLIEEGYPSSSGTLEWAISVLYADDPRQASDIYKEINDSVLSVPPDENALIFMPYLRGSRDDSNAEGVWLGLKPFHKRAHMLEALYEGVVFTHKIQMSYLLSNRDTPKVIKVAGGATTSQVWMQMFADAMQIPLEVYSDEEMGVKGASVVAATAIKIYNDLDEAVDNMTAHGSMVFPRTAYKEIYERKYERFLKAYSILREFWN